MVLASTEELFEPAHLWIRIVWRKGLLAIRCDVEPLRFPSLPGFQALLRLSPWSSRVAL